MELCVNEEKKKAAVESVISNTPKLKSLWYAYKASFIAGTAIAFMSFFVSLVIAKKTNYISIVIDAAFWLGLGAVFSCVLKALLANLSGKDLTERGKEVLIFEENGIRYIFNTLHHTGNDVNPAVESTVVVSIPYDSIKRIEYDETVSKLTFIGGISSSVTDDYERAYKLHPSSHNLKTFDIYDYFEPGLLDTVRGKGLCVTCLMAAHTPEHARN